MYPFCIPKRIKNEKKGKLLSDNKKYSQLKARNGSVSNFRFYDGQYRPKNNSLSPEFIQAFKNYLINKNKQNKNKK